MHLATKKRGRVVDIVSFVNMQSFSLRIISCRHEYIKHLLNFFFLLAFVAEMFCSTGKVLLVILSSKASILCKLCTPKCRD